MMAWWAAHSRSALGRWAWVAAMFAGGVVALALEWRTRIALAWCVALHVGLVRSGLASG